MLTRRQFNRGIVLSALSGLAINLTSCRSRAVSLSGDLKPDPAGILALPPGFNYRIISGLGTQMDDGLAVPDRADGMGCIALDKDRIVLIRNHELMPKHSQTQLSDYSDQQIARAYDTDAAGRPLPGGTSSIIYNMRTQKIEKQFMSLLGTMRNCSGGPTPWGSWLSCEESVENASSEIGKNHGYVFEIPGTAETLVSPAPIKAMGRFNHEAACVDPATGAVYLTEDRDDSLLYRFVPDQSGNLHAGGTLQALAVATKPQFDTRNWQDAAMSPHIEYPCHWVDLENVDGPDDDLRHRGHAKGAALFARGEGIAFGDGQLYFCCTSGGAKQLGQVMRLRTTGATPSLSLFLESAHPATFNYGDNLCIAPNGHLVVCEDQYTDVVNNHLKGVTPDGNTYDIAKVYWQTEPAGACFSPDGSTLFVNLYSPTATLAITGPWNTLGASG